MHYVQCGYSPGVSLFRGAVFLRYQEKAVFTDAEFADSSLQTAIGQNKVVVISQADVVDIKGDYPVTAVDRILTEGEGVSVDTSLAGVRLTLFPSPVAGSGVAHIVTPAVFSWETHNVQLAANRPIAGHDEVYYLDVSVPVLATFVGGDIGWRVVPLT